MSNEPKNGLNYIHEYDVDVEAFVIYLMGREDHPPDNEEDPGIEYRIANRFIRNLDFLSSKDSKKPILVVMKVGGGSWDEGMAIYDAILAAPNHITIISYAQASSMSGIILQAADKRVLMPNSHFMFHDGTTGVEGTWKQVESDIEFWRQILDVCRDIYAIRMKNTEGSKVRHWSKKRIIAWIDSQFDQKQDVFLTPEDAVKWGFADKVFTDWGDLG
jgi:ATP-dependent Clp endopeptidase proteolytic subunit ClpP